MAYLEEMYIKLMNHVDNHYQQCFSAVLLLMQSLDKVYFHYFYLYLFYSLRFQAISLFPMLKAHYPVSF